MITQYLHLARPLVKQGDRVKACQQIALSGNSGKSIAGEAYAAHLDYRIRFDTNRASFVDILCPCKIATNRNTSGESNIGLSCAHSLFNAPYKFKSWANRRSQWRVEHGHCLTNVNGLLPDEIHP